MVLSSEMWQWRSGAAARSWSTYQMVTLDGLPPGLHGITLALWAEVGGATTTRMLPCWCQEKIFAENMTHQNRENGNYAINVNGDHSVTFFFKAQ